MVSPDFCVFKFVSSLMSLKFFAYIYAQDLTSRQHNAFSPCFENVNYLNIYNKLIYLHAIVVGVFFGTDVPAFVYGHGARPRQFTVQGATRLVLITSLVS